jgi:beta-lactamase class A
MKPKSDSACRGGLLRGSGTRGGSWLSELGRLSGAIEEIVQEAGGHVAVALRHLPSGQELRREAEAVFPSASVIKVAILVTAFAEVSAGRRRWDERFSVTAEACVEGSGVLRELHAGLAVTFQDLARLMIVVSDNTASNMLIDAVGAERVNEELKALGCQRTRLGRKFYDFAARDAGRENFCAAGELADLMARLERGEVVSAGASAEMLAIMRRQAITHKIPALLPPETPVAHKTGEITGVSHDVGIIFGPSGPLVLAVLTQGCRDRIAAETAIRRIARAAHDAFNG